MQPAPGLSTRARAFLRRAAVPSACAPDLARSLALVVSQGLPVFPVRAEFESAYGGLRIDAPGGVTVLGLAEMAAEDPDLRMGSDDTRVVVGRQGEWTTISISADGRLWSHGPDSAPWALAASPRAFIEVLAVREAIAAWAHDPFRVAADLAGAKIAAIPGLRRDEDASDGHLVAFRGEECHGSARENRTAVPQGEARECPGVC